MSEAAAPRSAVVAIGATHRQLTVGQLRQLRAATAEVSARIADRDEFTGYVNVSTCNRFEIYVESVAPGPAIHRLLALIGETIDDDDTDLLRLLEVYDERATVEHLFAVASGLNSMLVGENEVLGQVRDAFRNASDHAGPALFRLFEAALA
ncbi:MAG: hypothetical protein ACK5KO_13915, partial [Arachnia sp.]